MFIDASAIVAILTREPEADTLADLLSGATAPITSPIALFEAVAGICRKRQLDVVTAEKAVHDFLHTAGIAVVPVTAADGATALTAFSRFGKGRGHPAQLNMGDCFAYAVAMNHQVALLFKGDDFSLTDANSATLPR